MLHRALRTRRARLLLPIAAAATLGSLGGAAAPASAACNSVGPTDPNHKVVVCQSQYETTVSVCPDWHYGCANLVELGRTGVQGGSMPTVTTAPPPQVGVKTSTATIATVYVNGIAVPLTVTGVCAGPDGTFC